MSELRKFYIGAYRLDTAQAIISCFEAAPIGYDSDIDPPWVDLWVELPFRLKPTEVHNAYGQPETVELWTPDIGSHIVRAIARACLTAGAL